MLLHHFAVSQSKHDHKDRRADADYAHDYLNDDRYDVRGVPDISVVKHPVTYYCTDQVSEVGVETQVVEVDPASIGVESVLDEAILAPSGWLVA
mgnify:CR=1 FL=1